VLRHEVAVLRRQRPKPRLDLTANPDGAFGERTASCNQGIRLAAPLQDLRQARRRRPLRGSPACRVAETSAMLLSASGCLPSGRSGRGTAGAERSWLSWVRRSAAADLRGRGLHTTTGKPFSALSLRDALLASHVAGIATCNGAQYDASSWLEPIIEPDRWQRLTEMLTDPARRTNPPTTPTRRAGHRQARCQSRDGAECAVGAGPPGRAVLAEPVFGGAPGIVPVDQVSGRCGRSRACRTPRVLLRGERTEPSRPIAVRASPQAPSRSPRAA
jgi:hypothetical protein